VQFRLDAISPAFFETVGARLLKGRSFLPEDNATSRALIVNEKMARLAWPDADPIGQKISFGTDASGAQWFTIVGIVEDMRRSGPQNDPMPQAFEPLDRDPPGLATLLVRASTDDPLSFLPSIKSTVTDISRYVPVYAASSLELQLGDFVAKRRVQTSLVVIFSALALLIAAIGLYSVVQYSVSLQTHEIGIRMAVGAERQHIFRMVVGQGLRLALIGEVIGIAGALTLTRFLSSLLYGVKTTDPLIFVLVSMILITAATLACYIPAQRAMRVDPMVALRYE